MDSSPESIKPIKKTNKLALLSFFLELILLFILSNILIAVYTKPAMLWRHGCYRDLIISVFCQPYSVLITIINILSDLKYEIRTYGTILYLAGAFLGLVSLITGIVALVQIKRRNQPASSRVIEKGAVMATLGIILATIQLICEIFIVAYIIMISLFRVFM